MNRLDLNDLLHAILRQACKLVGTEHGFVFMEDPSGECIEVKVGRGMYQNAIGFSLHSGESLSGYVWKHGKPLFVQDYNNSEYRVDDPIFHSIHAAMVVPLKAGQRVIGTFGLVYLEPHRKFTEEHIELLTRFGELTNIALENARLYSELNNQLTEKQAALRALEDSEARYTALFQGAQDAVFVYSIDKNRKISNFSDVNVFACDRLNYSKAEMLQKKPIHLLPRSERKNAVTALEQLLHNKTVRLETCLVTSKGELVPFEINQHVVYMGNKIHVLAIGRDIKERKQMETRLQYISSHDALTDLFNRVYFEERMQHLLAKNNLPIGIIVGDVDGLKFINDTLGHIRGDGLLITAAKILSKSVRYSDIVARIGGDEFAILLPRCSEIIAKNICSRVIENVCFHNVNIRELPLSISLGFAISSSQSKPLAEVFQEADDNMYRQKIAQRGKSRIAIVHALMYNLEERDYINRGHVQRMQVLVEKVKNVLNLTEQDIDQLKLLVRFHDIGKVGVSEKILFKEVRLTQVEYREIQRHSEIGYRIALATPSLVSIADYILSHHEWWNGGGYPLGISGVNIPLYCRILALIDAYEVMVSGRPYQKPMAHNKALEEIENLAGKQFDPTLTEMFVHLMRESNPNK